MAKRSLVEDYLAGRPEAGARFAFPRDGWLAAAAMRRERPAAPWAEVELEELRRFHETCGSPRESLRALERLANPDTLVVATGQQAGIALGPLYTLYKALGAVGHARRLEAVIGRPVVACFWIASEDHDFEEVRDVAWLGKNGSFESFRYEPVAPAADTAVGDISVEDSLKGLVAALESTTAQTEFRPAVLEWLTGAISAGGDLEQLFARLLVGLLGRLGLVAITPRMLRFRRRAAALFGRELDAPGEASRLIIAAGEQLRGLGYEPQLHRRPEDTNFFLTVDGRRAKLAWDGGRLAAQAGGETLRRSAPDELRAAVDANPLALSVGAGLRPLVQDLGLNTIGYLGGPGELAYFAQLKDVYEARGVPMPVIAPRPSVALIDARTRRFLDKIGVQADEYLGSAPEEIFRRALTQDGGGDALRDLDAAGADMNGALERLKAALGGIAPAIDASIEKLAAAQDRGFQALRERLERELSGRNEAARRQWETVERWLRPDGRPQERVYSALSPLLVNYGLGAAERLLGAIDLDATGMQAVELGDR